MRHASSRMMIHGYRYNVVVEGRGRPVLLLHGFPDSSHLWRSQIDFLVFEGFKVIAPDLRGFGDTEARVGKEEYHIDMMANDIACMMDNLGIERAPVVGHDWGAVLGWVFSMNHPECVDRYVAISVGHPVAYRSDLEQKLRSWYAAWFQIPGISELSVRAADWRLLRTLTGNHPETCRWVRDLARSGRLTAGINWYRANFTHMLFHDFPRVKVPVLGIWSSGDRFLSEGQMVKSAKWVEGPWRYERIDGASHWIPLDAPGRLNRLLLEYLNLDLAGMNARLDTA